ncbi:MAG: DUF3080 domain-containing protein [Marinobacter sp.]|uniref:DUF3080 domain-containing protein n=1 Tax=Marinobacter sp. TaxID=50741 RepID=UPI00299DA9F2|nr:DUF3080 domain-containing protein [Marinobacter sp.]MDX1635959.1 DUF3080 domain-containing protein [Marinobacter sp.]
MMDEYVERTARVLELEPRFSAIADAPRLPRRRERQLPVPELEIDMLDFLSLYGCDLQVVVGEKNSIMGRVMQPLNRLRYELRFIEAARECLPDIEREELADSVREAVDGKLESLPVVVWNATWGVEEIESLLTLAKGPLPVDAIGATAAALGKDLERLNGAIRKLNRKELALDLEFVGRVHQHWDVEYRAGQVLNSAVLLITRLQDATGLIRQRLEGRPLCFEGKANNQARIVQSMFFSVYVERVQPYLADVSRVRAELIEPLAELASLQQAAMPASFRSYFEQGLAQEGGGVWHRLDQATDNHTRAWQQLLEQCGMRPGA